MRFRSPHGRLNPVSMAKLAGHANRRRPGFSAGVAASLLRRNQIFEGIRMRNATLLIAFSAAVLALVPAARAADSAAPEIQRETASPQPVGQ